MKLYSQFLPFLFLLLGILDLIRKNYLSGTVWLFLCISSGALFLFVMKEKISSWRKIVAGFSFVCAVLLSIFYFVRIFFR